jgi:hypothetical protein
MKRALPWIILGVFLIYVAAAMFRPVRSSGGFNVAEFGRLPVLMSAHVQPLDSVAHLALFQIRGTMNLPVENPNARRWQVWKRTLTLDPAEWLLEVLAKPAVADTRKIFPINDSNVLSRLQLKPGAGEGYYAFKDLQAKLDEIGKETARIAKLEPGVRAAWERQWLKLQNALVIYERLKNSLQPNSLPEREAGGKPVAFNFAASLDRYQSGLRESVKAAAARKQGKQHEIDQVTVEAMRAFAGSFVVVSRASMLSVIPPTDPVKAGDRWEDIGTSIVNSARTGRLPVAVGHFAAMSSAYAHGKPEAFNAEVAKYEQWLSKAYGPQVSKVRTQSFNNMFKPFVRAAAIYFVAFVLLCLFWFKRSTALYRSALTLVVLAGVLHTTGLILGLMIEGRLPFASVYGSIIAAGWIVLLLAALAQRFWRKGPGLGTAAAAGLIALTTAHSLAPGGPAEWIRAVFDMSFLSAIVAIGIIGIFIALAEQGGSSGSEGRAFHMLRRIANAMRSPRRVAKAA